MTRRVVLAVLLAFALGLYAGRALATVRQPAPVEVAASPTAGPLAAFLGWSEPSERPEFSTPTPTVEPSATPKVVKKRVVVPASARFSHSLSGQATWFATGPDGLFAAAGPRLRAALGPTWRGHYVQACTTVCIRVLLNDYCRCSEARIIDLSDQAFRLLAPLSRGVIPVTVRY